MTGYDNVFHPTDLQPDAENAFAHALRIALASRGLLSVVHIGDFKKGARWEAFPHVRPLLARWGFLPRRATMRDLRELGMGVKKVEVGARGAARNVAGYIMEHEPNLVVISTHRRKGVDRLLHASISETIARRTHARTLFVPRGVKGFVRQQTGEVSLRRILVPLKPGLAPQMAVDEAAHMARLLGGPEVRFTLMHVGSKYGMPRVRVIPEHDWLVERLCVEGVPGEAIVQAARVHRADLIVMVTQGHDGFLDAIRGNSTERVLHEAPCPVLAVPKHRR
jgi:nucleotide-binding universal stress UspA family protein